MAFHRLFVGLLAMALAGLTAPAPASAGVRIGWHCQPDERARACATRGGIEHIAIYGEIDDDTAVVIGKIDGMLPADRPFPRVYINSPGGDVDAGVWIGRILRRRGASIEGKDVLFPGRDAECASACVIVAAGAVKRQFEQIGVHQGSRVIRKPDGKFVFTPLSAAASQSLLDYFDEMGVPPAIKAYIEATPSDEMMEMDYDPDLPREQQPIVMLGFHMVPDDPDALRPRKGPFLASPRLSITVDQLEKGAADGDWTAAKALADMLYWGNKTLPKDGTKALKYYMRASDLGDLSSRYRAGAMLEHGRRGVPIDLAQALKHYQMAAQAEHATARVALARMYLAGRGVPRSAGDAIYWATLAAEQGEPYAYALLGELRYNGVGFVKDDVQTYKWLTLASQELPEGKTKERNKDMLYAVSVRMKQPQITAATAAMKVQPLKVATHRQISRQEED